MKIFQQPTSSKHNKDFAGPACCYLCIDRGAVAAEAEDSKRVPT